MAAVIDGPANIIVKTGNEPIIGTPVMAMEAMEEREAAAAKAKKSK
jgi:hypothetical protein